MSHKLDRKRQRWKVKNKHRRLKSRYMKLTQNDSLAPDKALAALKDSDQLDLAKRLARKLAARRIHVRLAAER